jgi:hypothetical protein
MFNTFVTKFEYYSPLNKVSETIKKKQDNISFVLKKSQNKK